MNNTSFLDRVFHLKENGTTIKTEILAGATTFMTMAYILAVNPMIMGAIGMDKGAVLTATCLASFIGTLLMALLANYPFALAPGMGLNAFFAYTVVMSMGYSWETALSAVFFAGVIFILLTLTNLREAIFNAIPMNLKKQYLPELAYLFVLSDWEVHILLYLMKQLKSRYSHLKVQLYPVLSIQPEPLYSLLY